MYIEMICHLYMFLKVRDLERELGEAHGELTTQEERLTGLRELLQQRTQRLEDINDQHILVQVCVVFYLVFFHNFF